ncbi:MAG: APC family permease [Gemmatimonadetes bacterium]|nr:APC family permease [Gemmatimonadota bacterium]
MRSGALGFVSTLIIGVASTAPGYGLAAVLGLLAITVGLQSPAVLILGFLPILLIAVAFAGLNRIEPDCGTTFTWVTRAMGPWVGWMGGWVVLVTGVVVMANLGQVAGRYTFLLVGWEAAAASTAAVTLAGCAWIGAMTWVSVVGIEVSARTQRILLGTEILALAVFSAAALVRVYSGAAPDGVRPSLTWLDPRAVPSGEALAAGILLAIFLYWGWESSVSVNEESRDPARVPGRAAIVSTLVLVALYVGVAIAAQAVHGADFLARNRDDVLSPLGADVLGAPLDRLLLAAVLTSAAAATQATILPTTRTCLSMAAHGALPAHLGYVHPLRGTPSIATLWTGGLSIVWYVGLTVVSEDLLYDGILSMGLMVSFSYALTALACPILRRREVLQTLRGALLLGVVPLAGAAALGWAFVRSCVSLANPAASSSGARLGVGAPLVVALSFVVLGGVLMLLRWFTRPEFFTRNRAPDLTGEAPPPSRG